MRPFLLAVLLAGLFAPAALAQPSARGASDGRRIPAPDASAATADRPAVHRGGVLTFYATRAEFDAVAPGLFVEDFEDVNVPGISCWCTSPVDSNTDNECYDPGTLAAPLGLAAFGPTQHEFDALIAHGPGYFGQPSIVAGANLEVDTTVAWFDPGVYAAGMDVYAYFGNPGITVDVYDTAGTLLGSTTVPGDTTGTFFGVISDGAPIGDIRLDADDDYTMLDNVAVSTAPVGTGSSEGPPPPFGFAVHPNPLQGTGTVTLTLARPQHVLLSVHDGLGREVAILVDRRLEAGSHEVPFDGSPLPSGSYLVRLEAGGAVETRRVTLVR